MPKFSLGGNLVLRQALFLALIVSVGVTGMLISLNLRDEARAMARMSPEQAMGLVSQIASDANNLVWWLGVGTGMTAALILGVSIPVMHKTLSQPFQRLARKMSELAAGDTSIEITDTDRRDEIGEMARALMIVRDAVRGNNDLMSELKARDDREAQLRREASIRDRVETFSSELTRGVTRLGDMTKQMSKASESMTAAARRATEDSSSARLASRNAAADVSSVAQSSEQLLESIGEINRQVVQSTTVVQRAVEEAQQSSAGMARLSAAARRVGDVVSLISRIAAQTNLLALNATIEAARAGEAGRGFAVVAQEVKNLATQTAKATQDIADQIAEMQAATNVSVDAIEMIQRKIGEVEQISTIIAAAVHEQGAATQEITRNVRSAASGAAAMSSHVESVESAVNQTGASADTVVDLAHALDEMATSVRVRVDQFASTLVA
jgi:methyl-accepting chemotaxis protein